MKTSGKTLFLCFTAVIVVAVIALGRERIAPMIEQLLGIGSTSVNAQTKPSYYGYAKRIDALAQTRDLKGLIRLKEELDKAWSGSFVTKGRLVSQIIDALTSYDFGDVSQYDRAIRYTTELLSRADELPVSVEAHLVGKLQSTSSVEKSPLSPDQWRIERDQRLSQLRHLCSRVYNEIDPRFAPEDPANRPVGNVVAPGSYLPGVDPKSIREPDLRQRYEAAIEANRLKAERYSQQVELRNIQAQLPDLIEQFLSSLYAIPPVDSKDLEMQMHLLNLDQASEDRIRARLRSLQR